MAAWRCLRCGIACSYKINRNWQSGSTVIFFGLMAMCFSIVLDFVANAKLMKMDLCGEDDVHIRLGGVWSVSWQDHAYTQC